MSGWGSSRGNWQTGGMEPTGQGGSAGGYSYLHQDAATSNRNTKTPGGWNYGRQVWDFEYGKSKQQQWSTNADDEDWGFNSGRTNPTPIGWGNTASLRASGYQNNQGGWKSGVGDGTGTRGVKGNEFRGGERKRPRYSGSSDLISGKRRQFEGGSWGNRQDYNYYDESVNTGHDYSGWDGGYDGFRGANKGFGNSQVYDDWNQIPSQGSNWGAAGEDYYDEDEAYNCQFDFGGGYQGGYQDPQGYYDKRPTKIPAESEEKWRSKIDTFDDKLMYNKLRTLMQVKDERKSLVDAVRNIMNAMRNASEALSLEAHQTLGEAPVKALNAEDEKNGDKIEETLPPQVLIGVIRVGPAIRKILIKESPEMGAELVAVFKNKPTKDQFRRLAILIAQNLKSPFADKVSIVPDELVEKIVIRVQASECPYPITISCTSPEYCPEFKDETSSDIKPREPLTEERCMEALATIRRVRWSKQLRGDIELPIVRIFLDLATRLPDWNHLKPYPAEVLVHTVMKHLSKDVRESEITISRVFTQCIEILAEGLLLKGGPGLKDPCETNPTDVFSYLTPQAAEDLTKAAQMAVRLIACSRMKILLQLCS